jgi:predicted GH43/DUF377 family glycosyl hydrolase
MQSQTRYFHLYSDVLFPVKGTSEGVPTVYEQAESLGGTFTRIVKGLPEGSVANFNPSIAHFNNSVYVTWRSQPEAFGFRYDNKYFYLNNQPNEIYIGLLGADGKSIIGTKKIRPNKHRLSYEDPRLFIGPDKNLYIQFVASTYASKYDGNPKKLFHQPKVIVCWLNENFQAVSAAIPPIGKNRVVGEAEKNWAFFTANDELNCLYSTRPLVIERESGVSTTLDTQVLEQVTKGCATFNSTAPLDLGYGYLIFYHWKHMTCTPEGRPYLIYHVGAYMTDKKFEKVTYLIEDPIFTGSLNDRVIEWTDYNGTPVSNQPAVILPFGALLEGDELVMSLGVNDAFMGIFRTKLENIMRRLKKVD